MTKVKKKEMNYLLSVLRSCTTRAQVSSFECWVSNLLKNKVLEGKDALNIRRWINTKRMHTLEIV